MPRRKHDPNRIAIARVWTILGAEGVWRYTSNPSRLEIQTGPLTREEVEQLSSRLGWPVTLSDHGFQLAAPGEVTVFGRYLEGADGHPVREVKREDGSSAFLPASSPAIAAMVA